MDSQLALIVAVGAVLVVAALAAIIVWQRNQMRQIEQPRYGFLGKTLPALITTLVLGAGLVGSVYLVQQDETTVDTSADVKIEVNVTRELIAENDTGNTYLYHATPSINGDAYGTRPGERFDVFWTFTGPQNLSKSEIGLTETNPSQIQISLQRGTYDLTLLVQYYNPTDGKTYSDTFKQTIVI